MSKELTEKYAIITPENCQEINAMISEYKKKIERLQDENKKLKEQIEEANLTIQNIAYGEKKLIGYRAVSYLEKYGLND